MTFLILSKPDYLFVNYTTISDGRTRRSRFKPYLFGNLNKMRFAYSLCSANIVNRKSWNQHTQEQFFNTNFWHLHTISNIISAPNSLALSTSSPMIKNIGPSISESRSEHGFEFYAKAWKASIQIAQSLDCSQLTRLHLMSICLITVHWNLYTEQNQRSKLILLKNILEILSFKEKLFFYLLYIRRLGWNITKKLKRH